MAGIPRLIDTSELKTALWHNAVKDDSSHVSIYYNDRVDAITLLIVSPKVQNIVHYIDDHVALLYNPENNEIIGVRVESFQKSFLPKYAQLEKVWKLSESGVRVENFGDLIIAVKKYEEQRPLIANEISRITGRLVEREGIRLEPVPA